MTSEGVDRDIRIESGLYRKPDIQAPSLQTAEVIVKIANVIINRGLIVGYTPSVNVFDTTEGQLFGVDFDVNEIRHMQRIGLERFKQLVTPKIISWLEDIHKDQSEGSSFPVEVFSEIVDGISGRMASSDVEFGIHE